MMLPLAQSIIAQAAGPARFGRAMSLVAIPAQLAPVVGGFIVTGLGWRWIFYVNVPVCARSPSRRAGGAGRQPAANPPA
jgi:MFS family permease